MNLKLVCKRCHYSLNIHMSNEDYYVLKELQETNTKNKIDKLLPKMNSDYKAFFKSNLCRRCQEKIRKNKNNSNI